MGQANDMHMSFGLSLGALPRHHAEDAWAVGVVCLVGTLRRYHAMGVGSSRAMQGWAATIGTPRRYHPSGRNGAAAQMGRSGDTMFCEKATLCTRVQVGTARDVLRHHTAGVWSSCALLGLGRVGDTIRRVGLRQLH